MSTFTLAALLDLLALRRVGDHRFEGAAQEQPDDRVYGGLLLAQALTASARTVPVGMEPVSLQAEFLAGVRTDRPICWQVTELSNTRSMVVRQAGVVGPDGQRLFVATTRFAHRRQDLPSYSHLSPADTVGPEGLLELHERFGSDPQIPLWWRTSRPVSVRHVEPPPYRTAQPDIRDSQTVWVRALGAMPDDPVLHAAVLAYTTDMTIMESAFRATGSTRHGPGSKLLSITHSLTFHHPCDIEDWHQFDQRCPRMSHGRALGQGELFDRSGRHVASTSQQALVKFQPPATSSHEESSHEEESAHAPGSHL